MDAKLALIPALPDILHLLRMRLDPPPELPKLSDYAPRSLLIRWKKIFCASCNETSTPRSGRKSLIDRGLEGLETRLEAYLSLFAPIRKLPAEILLEIFAFDLDLVLDEPRLPRNWDQDAMAILAQVPVRNLAQVCASWRALVNANPTLWNTVTIPGRPSISPSLSQGDMWYQQFHLTIQRTAAAPLNINAMRLTSEWVPHLVDGITRWRHVRLTTTTGVLENLRSVAIGKLFLLESFTLVDFSRPAPGCLDLLNLSSTCTILNASATRKIFLRFWMP
uniref:F-box domain-containing protein n=1 Tax=Mycena chlorophos TaxID=658473 RepID=A0ABQ0KU55_MYCCL|nr:predicted protein [Mycena chlorophos]